MESIYAENIIRARNAAKEEECVIENHLEKGYIIVKYEKMELDEREFLDGQIVMLIPKLLQPMPEDLIQIKYPNPEHPEWIVSDEEGKVSLGISLERGEIENGDIEENVNILKKEMQRMYPASKIEIENPVGEGKEKVYWFSLDIPLIDDICCHVMFFREVKGGLLMGTLDCSKDEKKMWKDALRQILGTIKDRYEKYE